jgi:molecular chaperone HtpG
MAKGNIGVTTENIFPVIKKFLYSDHEIFLREMVSNAVDATQKLKTLAEKGDFKGEIGDTSVHVILDKEAGTLTFRDHGIGMTADEIERYINQIAFSGVTDFLDKYKDNANAIIGHFGLGFYSSFMVADKVEILTRSYQEGAKAVKWSCDGSPEYELEDIEGNDWRAEGKEHGSDIVLHIADDCKDFLEKEKITQLLNKYCKFMPVNIVFGKKQEWNKDEKKMVDTAEDNVINNVEPLWTKTPSTLKDEDYKSFYSTLYPMQDEPLFWIHLNVDFPFHLTGILYFPRVQSNIDLQRNKIQLYCNQVFVTDQIEGIVPDFLTLLHGVIDSPDIPLNVSRSYLQSDQNVKKIATYITKKVSDRLAGIFKSDRKDFEEKWDSLKIFINYGMLTEESFYDRAKEFALLKDTEGKHFTFEEYKTLIKDEQTDKDGTLVYLYANNKDAQYSYIETAKAKGYSVLMMDGQLDTPIISMLEQKFEKSRFTRVDSDIIERLIPKEDAKKVDLSKEDSDKLTEAFKSKLPTIEKANFNVEIQALGEDAAPALFTQSEYMRRMKDISRYQSGMGFYSEMPDSYTLILNSDNAIIKGIVADTSKEATISQLIDLALLQNGMLTGETLDKFLKRSIEIMKN